MKKDKKGNEFWILGSVSVVAIVGIVAIFMASNTPTTFDEEFEEMLLEGEMDDEGNLVGEAYRSKFSTFKTYCKGDTLVAIYRGRTKTKMCEFGCENNRCLTEPAETAYEKAMREKAEAQAAYEAAQAAAEEEAVEQTTQDMSAQEVDEVVPLPDYVVPASLRAEYNFQVVDTSSPYHGLYNFTVTANTSNIGSSAALTTSYTSLRMENENSPVYSLYVPGLDVGEHYHTIVNVYATACGLDLVATADSTGVIAEEDETNNVRTLSLNC